MKTNEISNGKYQITKHKFFIVLIFIAILNYSCKKPTSPDVDDTPKPGKRNYSWTIDSIDYGGRVTRVELQSMWGNSATDVWGAARDAPDVRDCLWHYDGVKWSRATAGTPITEFTDNKTVYAVWGSAVDYIGLCTNKIVSNSV